MKAQLSVLGLSLLVSTASLFADTLVLNNGRRLQGELIGVYGREIEFEERDGGRRRTIRVPRVDIERIEFGNDRESSFDRGDRDRDDRTDTAVSIPRGMLVIAKDQLATDARYFASSTRRLRVAQVA